MDREGFSTMDPLIWRKRISSFVNTAKTLKIKPSTLSYSVLISISQVMFDLYQFGSDSVTGKVCQMDSYKAFYYY